MSGDLESGGLETRATDFGSGMVCIWSGDLESEGLESGSRESGVRKSGGRESESGESRATDFGAGEGLSRLGV